MTATEELLDPSCLRDLLQETNKANTKWYDIGLQLGVLAHVLDGLRIQYQNNPSDCYREALKEWLNGGEGSWRGLSQALSSNTVREHKLAKEIHRKLLPTQAEQDTDTASYRGRLSSSVNSSNSSLNDITPYGCGCGQCTFTTYVEVGCPQPAHSTSSFPFLNIEALTQSERQILHGRLYGEFEQICYKFSKFTRVVCESLIERGVSLRKLERSLRDLKAFQPTYSESPLLQERFRELKDAQDIDDVFDILTDYTSFFNYSIIEHIVHEHGGSGDQGALTIYQDHLMDYCKRNIFECPTYSPLKRGLATLVLKLEDEIVENGNMKHLSQLTARVSRTLCLSRYALNLCSVERGCVQCVYQLPVSVARLVLPLSCYQRDELTSMGVLKLACGKEIYIFTKEESPDPPPIPRRTSSLKGLTDFPSMDPPQATVCESVVMETHPWYHGNISRDEAEEILRSTQVDSFLIRRKEGPGVYALSEIYNTSPKHYIMRKTNGVYQSVYELENKSFPNIPSLVDYLQLMFSFQPCQRNVPPTEMIQLHKSDWVSMKTTGDCTGDSGFGTGTGEEGFTTALPTSGRGSGRDQEYTCLKRESLDQEKPYMQVQRKDDYKDYEEIGDIQEQRGPIRSGHGAKHPHTLPPIHETTM